MLSIHSQPTSHLALEVQAHLNHLCLKFPHRRVGSTGNRAATEYVARQLAALGLQVEMPEFPCLDWKLEGVDLAAGNDHFEIYASPYSLGCQVRAPLMVVSNLSELESVQVENRLLLLRGEIAREQLIPKNFPFYHPEEHLRIIQLLESKHPLAMIAATERNPELAGAAYPFSLVEDGNFDIPAAYLTGEEGNRLASYAGQEVALEIRARRIQATGYNIQARIGPRQNRRVVVCAHIDTKENTPGALDNASGVIVLLLLAELLEEYQGDLGIEILIINGEDHYSAAGELQYLKENQGKMDEILLAINLDMVGDYQSKTCYSFYSCPEGIAGEIRSALTSQAGFQEGESWYQSDHMVFAQNQVPAMALTSSHITELMANITHTAKDLPDLVDPIQLVRISQALRGVIRCLPS